VQTLTDLNPQIRGLRLGAVEEFRWLLPDDKPNTGFIVKPLDYRKGKRYPLVVYLDDSALHGRDTPFLFDGVQRTGQSIQVLASKGYVVFVPREPDLFGAAETPREGLLIRQNIESAIAALDREALIDTRRMGIAGFSRAAVHVDELLINGSLKFAAAVQLDGGGSSYMYGGGRPYTDDELKRISTPLLYEAHGVWAVEHAAGMHDRLEAWGRPNEILYLATAPHELILPQHRMTSLQTSLDWWEFWLMGREDQTPEKRDMYAHWHRLRGQ
jgi:dipeptidyl aminopeptidase/acylaminoacyl peptidase